MHGGGGFLLSVTIKCTFVENIWTKKRFHKRKKVGQIIFLIEEKRNNLTKYKKKMFAVISMVLGILVIVSYRTLNSEKQNFNAI